MEKIDIVLEIPGIEQEKTKSIKVTYKRLLLYGGARKSEHNNTFKAAAEVVKKDYGNDGEIILIKIEGGGQFVVNKINSYSDNSIQSIDFFTHGNDRSLLFKFDDSKNYQELYINDTEEQEQGITFWDRLGSLIGIGLDPDENKNGADISEINYNVFTNSAKIEFHGCNTASEPKQEEKIELEKKKIPINFASEFSKRLYNAGKERAVVIGHITKANPNGIKNDYRHGTRRVYHNGKELFLYRKEGRILGSEIKEHLK